MSLKLCLYPADVFTIFQLFDFPIFFVEHVHWIRYLQFLISFMFLDFSFSEWLLVNTKWSCLKLYHVKNNLYFDDMHFVLNHHIKLYFYSDRLQKQLFTGRHFVPLGHIILIPSQPVVARTP
jgi:hypothetical protein